MEGFNRPTSSLRYQRWVISAQSLTLLVWFAESTKRIGGRGLDCASGRQEESIARTK